MKKGEKKHYRSLLNHTYFAFKLRSSLLRHLKWMGRLIRRLIFDELAKWMPKRRCSGGECLFAKSLKSLLHCLLWRYRFFAFPLPCSSYGLSDYRYNRLENADFNFCYLRVKDAFSDMFLHITLVGRSRDCPLAVIF